MPSFNQLVDLRKQVQGKKLKKPAKWLFPHNAERHYRIILHQLVRELTYEIRDRLVPVYPELLAEVEATYPNNDEKCTRSELMHKKSQNLDMRMDDWSDRLRGIFLSIAEFIKPKVKETIIQMETIGNEISNFNQEQFQKVNRSVFGIDIFVDQPYLTDQLELFSRQNAQLITSIPEQDLLQVAGIVERGLQQGTRFTNVARDIQKRFGITMRRANLIARDQTTKLNSSLTQLRQESAGITHYIWQTAGDERVRPTHRANDGKKFSWDKPPATTGHPGHDINCRCVAIPVMEGIIE